MKSVALRECSLEEAVEDVERLLIVGVEEGGEGCWRQNSSPGRRRENLKTRLDDEHWKSWWTLGWRPRRTQWS